MASARLRIPVLQDIRWSYGRTQILPNQYMPSKILVSEHVDTWMVHNWSNHREILPASDVRSTFKALREPDAFE